MLRAVLLLVLLVPLIPTAGQAASLDHAVSNGWWYSQTGLPSERGFALVDDEKAKLWSEFNRLGGVDALGYPISHRFQLDGFTVQATQRVVLQWRPESSSVAFVNVFDRLHDLGHDGWLRTVRQTPEPARIDETGKSWQQVVRDRIALMDEFPAIRAKYAAAVGDPIQANGLPTSAVTDVGNHFSMRAQRVVFQQWKQDVPWAKKGEVTVALGGDIFKEIGLLPPEASRPTPPDDHGEAPTGEPHVPTAPLAGAVERFLVTTADFAGSRVVSEGATQPRDARGFRRVLARESGGMPLVALAEVDLFRDADAAKAYFALPPARDVQFRLEPMQPPAVGEETVAFRMVDGDHAARGHVVLFRRANAVAFVSLLAQVASPTLDETAALARAVDGRLR